MDWRRSPLTAYFLTQNEKGLNDDDGDDDDDDDDGGDSDELPLTSPDIPWNNNYVLVKYPSLSFHFRKKPKTITTKMADTSDNIDPDLQTSFVDETTSKNYIDHRPSYSDKMFRIMSDYCRETLPDMNLAVDSGCGPGNSTLGFTKYFKKVRIWDRRIGG